jgi:hypothetical protein
MKKFWIQMLEYAIRALIEVDWNVLKVQVLALWNDPRSGMEKRAAVMQDLKLLGCTAAEFIMKIAIEKAYKEIKTELENTK